jgi:phage tail sheath protein FI
VIAKNLIPEVVLQSCEVSVEVVSGDDAEVYEYVNFNPASQDYIENRMARSNLVRIQYNRIDEIFPPMLAICGNAESQKEVFSLSGGSDGSCKDAPDSVFIGKDDGPGRRTGLAAYQEISNVSLMAIPGVTTPAVQLALVTHCKSLGSRFAVLDLPLEVTKPQELLKYREVIDSDYAAMYHPWPQVYDMQSRKPAFVPPSGAVLGIFARSDTARGVHKAPANEIVNNCLGLSCLYSKAEQDLLNPKGVNLIRALPGQGIRVWGARTCSSDNLWKYVNVRRLFISIEETIKTQTTSFVFEPNDQLLWLRVRSTIVNYLRGLYRAGALVGATEDDAFFVRVGRDTMTQDDILNGRLIVEIGVAPSRPAEFVIFRITQKMEQEA